MKSCVTFYLRYCYRMPLACHFIQFYFGAYFGQFLLELILVDFLLKPSGREPVTRKATHQVRQQ